ncbi:MAG: pyridoxamine 5'-phosphate oxidase family protein [Thermomicrobiales bacterium]
MAIVPPIAPDAADPVSPADTKAVKQRILANRVTSLEQLRAAVGEASSEILNKHTAWLTPSIREYIAASPFFAMASSDARGNCDVTPRGDVKSMVQIIDDETIVIPDRLGNRRVDTFRNILENPHVGLLFFIPGVEEALRINGRATITTDPEILASMALQGKAPNLGIVVEIDEVFVHCARAMLRARLWKPDTWPDDDTIPTLAQIWNEQKNLPPPDESAGKRREAYREVLY